MPKSSHVGAPSAPMCHLEIGLEVNPGEQPGVSRLLNKTIRGDSFEVELCPREDVMGFECSLREN